jgi:hypothetical protein
MCCATDASWLNDETEIQRKLEEHGDFVDQVILVLRWKNPVVMGSLVVAVNLLFWFVRSRDLAFVPTFFLLLTIKSLLQFAFEEGGSLRPYAANLFHPIAPNDQYPKDVLVRGFVEIGKAVRCVDSFWRSSESASLEFGATKLALLLAVFIFFSVTKTFWVTFIVVNLVAVVPAVLLDPRLRSAIHEAIGRFSR